MSLLQKAKKLRVNQKHAITNEHIELALAWVDGEITLTAVAQAIGCNKDAHYVAYGVLARALREHLKRNSF